MTTKRESILNQIATTLAPTAGISGRIYRSRVSALARAESPAMVVEPIRDDVEQNTSLPTLDWTVTVRVAVIVRSLVPDQAADAIVEDMHSRIMADLTVGGYAIDVQPDAVSFDLVEADQPAGVISCNYLVRYRTAVDDLTTS